MYILLIIYQLFNIFTLLNAILTAYKLSVICILFVFIYIKIKPLDYLHFRLIYD